MENPTTHRWKTVRVFISSTFRDFYAERDYLVKYIFPEIREWCYQWKLHFVDIDLRWGVTEEQAKSGKVIDICLQEVDGSRPFFVCMLGNRYGWIPDKKDIPEETLSHYHKLEDKDLSITHMEIHHAVFEPLNADKLFDEIPHSFFYFRDENVVPDPAAINELSVEEKTELKKAFFEESKDNKNRLLNLKDEIIAFFKKLSIEKKSTDEEVKRIYNYSPAFNPKLTNPEDDSLKGRITPESLKNFGERVKNDLIKAIEEQYKERIEALSKKQEEKPLEAELDLHESFVENRTRLFVGRTELLDKLNEYVESDSNKILAVYGTPGCGKSALLAKFYRDYKESSITNPDVLFIPHFIGASSNSTTIYNLLRRFCEEIFNSSLKEMMDDELSQTTNDEDRTKINEEYEIPYEVHKLTETFENFINKTKQKAIILIDGLNQLDESNDAHELSWLPSQLPETVKIIASTLSGKTEEALQRKTEEKLLVTPLTDKEKEEIVRGLPSLFAKSLDDKLVNILLQRKETENPLYLKVAMDELRVFGSFEKLEDKINSLPSNVTDLFEAVIKRLEEENGEELVEKLFCLLECSRYGLTQTELEELLDEDKDKIHRIILRQIRDYLFNREEVIDFFHRSLSKAVRKKYFEEIPVEN